jgi:hypothetical protein
LPLSNYLKTTETVQQTVDAGRCCHGNRSVGAAPLKDQSCIRRRGWTKRGAEQLQASSWYRLLMPARMPLCPSYRAPCPMSGQSVAAHRVAGRAHRLASLFCCCRELVSPKMASRSSFHNAPKVWASPSTSLSPRSAVVRFSSLHQSTHFHFPGPDNKKLPLGWTSGSYVMWPLRTMSLRSDSRSAAKKVGTVSSSACPLTFLLEYVTMPV